MMTDEHHSADFLRHRLENLEARLVQFEASAPRYRRPGLSPLAYGLACALGFAGWAMAQPEMVPDREANDLVRDVGGITQVTAPFEVVDASGKVILSVRNDDYTEAAVSIHVAEGAGGLSLNSGEGNTVAALGADEAGHGVLKANDADGTRRASVSGAAAVVVYDESGSKRYAALETTGQGGLIRALNPKEQTAAGVGVDPRGKGLVAVIDTGGQAQLSISDTGTPAVQVVDNASKQLAVVESVNGKGRVAVVDGGRTNAEMVAAPAGGGKLVVHNAGGQPIAAVGTGETGKGSFSVLEGSEAVALMSADASGNGGVSVSNAQGIGGVELYGHHDAFDGGSVLVLNQSGEIVAVMATSDEGKGLVGVVEGSHPVAVLAADENGVGRMVVANAEGRKGVSASGHGEGESGGGSLMVFNQSGEEAVTLRVDEEGGGVVGAYSGDDATAVLTGEELVLYESGEPVVMLESDPGQLVVMDDAGEAVRMGLDDQGAGEIILSKAGKQLVSLEVTPAGEGEVDVYGSASDIPAAALRSKGGTGLVAVTNASGETASELSVAGGHGQVVVWHPGGQKPAAIMRRSSEYNGGIVQVGNPTTSVASLMVGALGEGFMQLTDASGTPMVAAGVTNDGRGRVDAGPANRCAPGGMGLTIPDCILGPKQ